MATPKSRPVFNEDDDTDSVNTDSTVESDLEAEYSVEKVRSLHIVICLTPLLLTRFRYLPSERQTKALHSTWSNGKATNFTGLHGNRARTSSTSIAL